LEKEMAAWAATRHSVEMAGLLDATACAKLMARARAVVLPSAWEETFGLAAVEAMAAGTPPIAAAHGSFPELITAGLDGVLVPPRDPEALAAAFQDVEKRPWRYEVLGRRARATYESRFDPDRGIEGLLDIYRYAIKHPV
jgi:glycosyltransferase involved in cell wall biosynthesis